jgi:hypothetical protein
MFIVVGLSVDGLMFWEEQRLESDEVDRVAHMGTNESDCEDFAFDLDLLPVVKFDCIGNFLEVCCVCLCLAGIVCRQASGILVCPCCWVTIIDCALVRFLLVVVVFSRISASGSNRYALSVYWESSTANSLVVLESQDGVCSGHFSGFYFWFGSLASCLRWR